MEIVIQPSGHAICIYAETLPLSSIGSLTITRASHVEPDSMGQWIADLSPVDGPQLGPFIQRSDALVAEVRWLEQHWLTRDTAG